MSLQPSPIPPVPAQTAAGARAAFRRPPLAVRLRDAFGALYEDADFAAFFPARGRPALPPGRLALVTVLQFLEGLSDRQASDAVRARIDWKYALGLGLADPGLDYSVLSEFRSRLVAGASASAQLLLDRLLARLAKRGLVKARTRQRTDSTHVLAAVRTRNRIELVGEALRAALNALAAAAPDWLRTVAPPEWHQRYDRRVEESRLPPSDAARAWHASPEGRREYALRSGVAQAWRRRCRRRCAPAARACGARRARYRGLARVHLQHVATAAALNVARRDAWLAGRPLAPTRVSRFARLAA